MSGVLASLIGSYSAASGAYDSIAAGVGNGSATAITFSSIPSTYTHLQVRLIVRGTRSFSSEQLYIRLNGDSGNNYTYHYFQGDGTGAGTGYSTGTTVYLVNQFPAANENANIYSASVIDVLDYTDTNKNTTMRGASGYDNNGNTAVTNSTVWNSSGLWMNTAAVTSLTVLSNGAFTTGTSVALYGIKGAL
jgi:hypothetical protein